MSWRVVFTRQAQKDARNLVSSGLKDKAQLLLAVLAKSPFQNPPPYEEKLVGDLAGTYSRRINIQHRLVYQVLEGSVPSRCCGCGRITSKYVAQKYPEASKERVIPAKAGIQLLDFQGPRKAGFRLSPE